MRYDINLSKTLLFQIIRWQVVEGNVMHKVRLDEADSSSFSSLVFFFFGFDNYKQNRTYQYDNNLSAKSLSNIRLSWWNQQMFFCPSLGRADISIPFSLFQILINILQHLMKLNNLAAGWRRQGR